MKGVGLNFSPNKPAVDGDGCPRLEEVFLMIFENRIRMNKLPLHGICRAGQGQSAGKVAESAQWAWVFGLGEASLQKVVECSATRRSCAAMATIIPRRERWACVVPPCGTTR